MYLHSRAKCRRPDLFTKAGDLETDRGAIQLADYPATFVRECVNESVVKHLKHEAPAMFWVVLNMAYTA